MTGRMAFLLVAAFAFFACKGHTEGENDGFKAEKVAQTASFTVNATIEEAFPLFGAFEERKWAPHWKPILIYPDQEVIEEGTTFKVDAHGHGHSGESQFLWVVTKYQPENYLIQYLVSTENRFWTITVKCESTSDVEQTKTSVTYSFIGLNEKGNELNKKALAHMFENNLQDWAEAINGYFARQ